jgi:dihydrofolate synthase / folylpolyglutamate synthase
MKITNLAAANTVLKNFTPNIQTTNWTFSLERMQDFMNDLDNPQESVKILQVAGTSGKTSTAYYIADMLHQTGKKVGLTVSPHVDNVNERIQINGRPLSEAKFCRLLSEFIALPAVKKANPSYFGLLIGFAFWVFAKEKVDYAVIEVGLGGRLDSTNVIKRHDKVCVITDIGLDHIAMLGDNLPSIAFEKAGIIQSGNQVLMATQSNEVTDVIKHRTTVIGAHLRIVKPHRAPSSLPLFQQRNWFVARAAVGYVAQRDEFAFTDEHALASAKLLIPARMEVVTYKNKTVILDGAHNAQKITALCASIKEKYPQQKLAAVVSFVHDKDESMEAKMTALQGVLSHLIITTFHAQQDMPKWSMNPRIIERAAHAAGLPSVAIIDTPKEAFAQLLARPEPIVLVTGSFYLLQKHIRPLIKGKP